MAAEMGYSHQIFFLTSLTKKLTRVLDWSGFHWSSREK